MHEHGVRGVLADPAVGHRVLRIDAAEHVLHVEGGALLVEVCHDPLTHALVGGGVVLLEVLLPPHLVFGLGPRHGEGVLHRPAGAARVGVEDERPVDAERRRKGLLLIVGSVRSHSTAVVLDGFVEQLLLAETVLVVDVLELEESFEFAGEGHDLGALHQEGTARGEPWGATWAGDEGLEA